MSAPGASFETLRVEVTGALGRLVLDRPEKLNPLSGTALEEIASAARFFDATPAVKVVLVSGAGRAFCAGADMQGFVSSGDRSTREAADLGNAMATALEDMRAVSVAALHGWCVGGGVVLASACDLRVASDDARFSIPEVDLGLPLAWGGIPRLVREIGPAATRDLVMTGRRFDAAEALSLGFVNRVVPAAQLEAEALALAESLASKAAHALLSTKRHVDAVTRQMVGTQHAWADADGLVTAFADEECGAARRRYLKARS